MEIFCKIVERSGRDWTVKVLFLSNVENRKFVTAITWNSKMLLNLERR